MHCIKRYLDEDRVECPFKAFLELIKSAYPLEHGKKTPQKDLRSNKENVPSTAFVSNKTNASTCTKRALDFSDDDNFQKGTIVLFQSLVLV